MAEDLNLVGLKYNVAAAVFSVCALTAFINDTRSFLDTLRFG